MSASADTCRSPVGQVVGCFRRNWSFGQRIEDSCPGGRHDRRPMIDPLSCEQRCRPRCEDWVFSRSRTGPIFQIGSRSTIGIVGWDVDPGNFLFAELQCSIGPLLSFVPPPRSSVVQRGALSAVNDVLTRTSSSCRSVRLQQARIQMTCAKGPVLDNRY